MKKFLNFNAVKWMFILSIAACCTAIKAVAQTDSVIDAYVTMETSANNPSLLEGTFVVILNDASAITNFEVKLGTSSGLSDVMSHTYAFDVTLGLPTGFTYLREGNKVTLGIGTYTDKSTYYGQARVQRSNGIWSQPLQFIAN